MVAADPLLLCLRDNRGNAGERETEAARPELITDLRSLAGFLDEVRGESDLLWFCGAAETDPTNSMTDESASDNSHTGFEAFIIHLFNKLWLY